MDNLTHTLTAVALSQAGFNRKTRFATLALVIGVNLPDVDLAARVGGSTTYLKYHRGITHSALGVTALAAMLAALVYVLGRRAAPKKSLPPIDGHWLFAACWIATASHLLLDLTNSYGVRPFLPFDGRWYAWDIMNIVDPVLWVLLLAGLAMPAIFRLVSEEVGARKPDYRWGAIFSLACMVLLWGLRSFAHSRALDMLDAHTYRQENPVRLGAFPSLANPFAWTGIVETDSGFHVLKVNALENDLDPKTSRLYNKPESSPALEAALKTRTGTVFSGFARFPWARVEQTEDGLDVTLQDLRFLSRSSRRRSFTAEIRLDRDLRVQSESFSFSGPAGTRGPG